MKTQARAIMVAGLFVAGCASSESVPTRGSMTMPVTDGLQPIADVIGPYGAVRYGSNAVAIRLWPDSVADGLAEFTLVVTNGTWNTVVVDIDDIRMIAGAVDQPVLGKSQMLARLASPGDATAANGKRDIGPLTERQSSRAASAAQGGMGGTRQSGDIGATTVDPSLISAARRAGSGRQPEDISRSPADAAAQRSVIEDWYLDTLQIFPGDTGSGGFSVPIPHVDSDLELQVSIDGEVYRFPVRYRRNR